jgi:hypothetical protein
MMIRGIAARPERKRQGLWISLSCGVSATACRFVGSFDEDAILELRPALTSATRWAGDHFKARGSYAARVAETSVLVIAEYQRSKVGRRSSFNAWAGGSGVTSNGGHWSEEPARPATTEVVAVIVPGTALRHVALDDDVAMRIGAATLRTFWRPVAAGDGLIPQRRVLQPLFDWTPQPELIDTGLVAQAQQLATALLN